MEELHSILCKHCRELMFHATCVDGASIRFDSYRELMSHRNFNGERIQTLQMIGYDGEDRKIELAISSARPKGPSIDCTYHFTQRDEETIFRQEIADFCDRAAKELIQPCIGKGIVFLLLLAIFYKFFSVLFPGKQLSIYACVCISAQIFFALFNRLIWYKLFPMVSFSWGEAAAYYRKIEKWKNGVFWGIVIAIPVAVFVNYLFNFLSGD